MTPAVEQAALETYAEIVARLAPQVSGCPEWELPDQPIWRPDQPFGPRTPIVLARAEQLRQADDHALNNLLHSASLIDCFYGSLTSPVALGIAAARPVGRRAAVERLQQAIEHLVEEVTEQQAVRWHRIVDRGLGCDRESTDVRDRIRRNASDLLRKLVESCLVTEAVVDVLAPEAVLAGRGPWLRGFAPIGQLPGPAWAAHPEILDKVKRLVVDLDSRQLAAVAMTHRESARGEDALGYSDVACRLEAWSVVAAAGCPWDPTLSTLPAWDPWLEPLRRSRHVEAKLAPVPEIQEWATCVTSALTFRARLSDQQVRSFAEPFRQLLPDLERMLNSM